MELGEGYKQMMTDENREKFEKANPEKSSYTVTYGDQTWNYSAKDMEMLSSAYARKLKNDSDFAQKAFNSYTDSDFDRFAYEHKLPSWKTWSTVQEYAQKYNASGSLADNYGGVSDDQWKKINELWAKDWKYGLTDADLARKAAGLAPVSYDSMYEDTLLDDELKAAGLPPSKLLNGKLGDKYNEWIDNSEKYNDLMTEVVREYASKTKDREEVLKNAKTAYAAMGREDEPVISEYTMTNALMSVLSRPEWSEYGTAHYGKTSVLPDKSDEKYVAKDEYGYPLYDDNGSKIYDETAWMNDYMKALTANEKLNADEFSITLEKAQEFYDKNYADIKAYDDFIAALNAKGVDPFTATEKQIAEVNDLYSGMQAEPLTVDQLFPEATDSQKEVLRQNVDKFNTTMKTQGVEAAKNYLNSDEFQKDVRSALEQDVVSDFRREHPESTKTDDQIKDDYYAGIATSYGMSAEQAAQFRSGELSIGDYMKETVRNAEEANTFAAERTRREYARLDLPDSKEAIESELARLEEEFEPIKDYTATRSYSAEGRGMTAESYKELGDTIRRRDELEKRIKDLKGALKSWDDVHAMYAADAMSYTDDFAEKTSDKEKVNDRFKSIIIEVSSSPSGNDDRVNVIDNRTVTLIRDNATDEEKAKLVYMYDTAGEAEAKTYAYAIARKYDLEEAKEKSDRLASLFMPGADANGFEKFVAGAFNTLAAITVQPLEAVYNAIVDTGKIAMGRELYASDRAVFGDTMISTIADRIGGSAGQGWSIAYQMVPSTAHSIGGMVAAYFTGGASEAFTLALMGTQAYSSTVQEALLNGADSKEAYTYGIAAGVAEVLFEKVSLDAATGGMKGVADVIKGAGGMSRKQFVKSLVDTILKNVLAQGGVEASEEMFTSISNLLTENLILGIDSSSAQLMQKYMDGGMDEDEAARHVLIDNLKSIGMDAALGFASGALMAFGSNLMITAKGSVSIDPTGTQRFLSETHDLSAISVDEAMEVANKVAIRDANGELTVDGAKRVVSEVLKKGADAATLSRVENEITTDNTESPVRDVFATAINDTKIKNAKTLAEAALRVAARSGIVENGATKARELTKEINEIARTYLNQMSETLQTADKATLQQTIRDMQQGLIDQVMTKSGYTYDFGKRIVAAQMASIPEAELQAGTEPVMVKLKQAGMTDATKSAFYANTAYTLMRSASDSRFTTALSSVFGKGASNVSSMIQNACLNSCSEDTVGFLDNVIEAIGMYATSDDASLARTLGANMNDAAYIASMMAIARGRKAGSNSRVMYEYVVNNGASKATLDALAAVTYYDNMPSSTRKAMDKYVIEHDDAMMTADKREAVSEQQAKAQQNVESKQALAEAQEKHNAQTLEAAESIVQRHQAASDAVRSTETVVDPSGRVFRTTSADLAEVAASYAAALSDAINARDNLAQANARRLEGAHADLNSAEQTFSTARKQFRTAMNRHSAAYVNMIGSQLEVIRGGGDVSLSEFDRITTLAANGTAEDLNSIKAKIIASEKRQAVCLGNEIGADVEIVKFTEQWFAEHGQKNGDVTKPACVIDGKMYLNESVWESRVGYGTDNVIWHEFSHIAQISGKNFNEFARLAYDFMCGKYGKENVDAFEKANGRAELAAEFARQELMTDPRAVKALCSNAPIMATRLYQWLSRISARHNNTIPQMQSIVNAQRMFAKTLKAATSDSKGNANVTVVERTNEAFNARNEVEEVKNSGSRSEQAENASAVQQNSQPAEDVEIETETVDNTAQKQYNIDNHEGEKSNGAESSTEQQESGETGESGSVQGLSGSVVPGDNQGSEGARGVRREYSQLPEGVYVTLSQKGISPVALNESDDPQLFYDRIGEAKRTNPYGAFVTQHETSEYADMRLLLDESGDVGVAVTNDGNIVSVFKNSSSASKGVMSSILLNALNNGGVKLDNFDSPALSAMYAKHGFVPVSRTAFVDEFAPSDWNYERDGRPDIVFWIHNGDSVETVAGKVGTYEKPDYASLPMFDDYEQAEAYRDQMLQNRAQQSAAVEKQVPATLPFELPGSASKIISTIVQNKQRNAIDGRVSPATNDEIRRIAKYQINKAAQAAGVTVDADTLNAYVEQFTLPEFETSGESWINGYKSTETKPTTGSSFAELYNSTARGDAEYYTEFKPVNDAINRLSASDRARLGNPRLVEGKSGMMVAQNVSADGFANGIVTASGDRNIATLARADLFTDGTNAFMYKRVGISDLAAAVIPNGREYAELRTAARKNGVNVVTYDASEPSQFENAVNLAARSDSVQYYTDFEKWIQQYGAQKPGSQPRIEGRPVPKRTAANNRVSQTARTIAESPFTSNEQYIDQQGYIANGSGVYRPVSNAKTMSKARADIDRMGGAVNALNKLSMDVASGSGKSTDLLAIAESLYMDPQAMMAFTPSQREQLHTNICLVAEDAGRGLQLVGELKRMSPQGHQFFMEQEGKRQAARYQKRTGMMIDLTLTEEERQAYANAKTPEEVETIDAAVTERWGKLTDHLTIGEKVRNWRYLSMLGNARTHFRNMVGNALMYPVVRVKDTINAGYQRLFGVAQEDRTTTAFTRALDTQTRAYVEEALQEALPIMQGVSSKYLETAGKNANTSDAGEGKLRRLLSEAFTDVASTHVTEGRTVFGRGLNKFASLNSNLLEIEDAISLGLRFRSSFAQQIQAKGFNVANITQAQRQQMMNYAMEESLRATFRDANTIADALNQFEKSHKVAGFFMGSIVPFKKTPLNIVRRSVEYSPIGLVQGAYKMISNSASYKSQINSINAMNISESEKQARLRQAEASYKADRIAAIDRLSAGTTGTILTALGFFAASMGWITIGRKDDDSASFETALGRNAYSLNIGDVSIDLSAFAPAAVPLLMGTALYEASHASEKDQSFTSEMIEVLCETLDPITEMSMLSGIADSLNGISYSRQDDGAKTQYLSTIGLNAAKSYVGQFIPTFAGQLARVTDPYARSYSAGSEYFASNIAGPEVGSAVKNLQNKIPLVAWLSEPKVDLHGDKIENYTNWGAGVLHVLNNLVLPATIKVDRKNEIDDEMVRLYGVTDGSDMFPEKPSRSLGSYTDRRTGDTTPIKLQNDAEYARYQMEYGQMVYDALEDLMRSSPYSRMTDDQKAEAIASVVKKTKEQVRSLWKAKKIKEMQ